MTAKQECLALLILKPDIRYDLEPLHPCRGSFP